MIYQDPKLNIIANSYNPIKIFIDITRMLLRFARIIMNLEMEVSALIQEIEQLIFKIIDERGTSDSLRNWLYEDYNRTYKVVDFLPKYKLLNLLNHPKITKTVEQMWMGVLDLNSMWNDDVSFILPIRNKSYS